MSICFMVLTMVLDKIHVFIVLHFCSVVLTNDGLRESLFSFVVHTNWKIFYIHRRSHETSKWLIDRLIEASHARTLNISTNSSKKTLLHSSILYIASWFWVSILWFENIFLVSLFHQLELWNLIYRISSLCILSLVVWQDERI